MDALSALSPANFSMGRNGHVGSHRFLVPIPSLCSSLSEIPNKAGHSRNNKSSLIKFPPDFKHGLPKSRQASRNFAIKINIPAQTQTSKKEEELEDFQINGEVILQKVSILSITDYGASLADGASELMGNKVFMQLVSSDQVDPETGSGKTADEPISLEWNIFDGPRAGDTHYRVKFKWHAKLGFPGAFLIKNMHAREFFLKSLTLFIPGHGKLQFQCYSWISPSSVGQNDRVFFANKGFLPEETPAGLKKLRELDLVELRGDGTGERKVSDRIYDYDVYNDIGDPDKDPKLRREVLGGSKEFPYPRRCRTGRPATKTAPEFEKRASLNFIPPDERFPYPDFSDFGAHTLMGFANMLIPTLANLFDYAFESFQEISEIYVRKIESPLNSKKNLHKSNPLQIVKGLLDAVEDSPILNFVPPQIILADERAWSKDEEFARQALAGLNPLVIQCLQKFPPSSSLDEKTYGPQQSTITAKHIEKSLQGLSVDQALASKRLFIIDYYDAYMPYAERINKLSKDANKTYASRTLYFLTGEGTLIPVAIELCLPPIAGQKAVRKVFTPAADETEEGFFWKLGKTHARVNDAGYHQLISHWLTTHCAAEPFIIATRRQLSTMHPLYKLLNPHCVDTMDINQAARQSLISADGIIEIGFTPGKYCMEMSSKVYKDWKFNEQGLPADLIKRGMALADSKAPHGLKLVIEDYPYAVDGLEIWFGLKQWVSEYLSLYYKDLDSIKRDTELQAWWDEIVNVGHGDLKDDPSRWFKMDSLDDIIEAVTTIIWTTSAHHAAVNFGQYAYGGYMPNLPTMSRRLIPDKGTPEYQEMIKNREAYYLKTVSDPKQTSLIMAVLEILSKHGKNEAYIGQLHGSTMGANDDQGVEAAFERFSASMLKIEKNIWERNNKSDVYKNRQGPAKVPYTLLYPNTSDLTKTGGLTGKGVPNSISI